MTHVSDDYVSDEEQNDPEAMKRESIIRQWVSMGHFMVVLLGVACVALAVIYLPIFRVNEVRVVGNYFVTDEDVMRIAGIHRGQNIFEVETARATKTLMKDLRIEEVVVRREFPNGILIDIEERRPVACVACEYGYLDIDRKGMVLRAYKTRPYQEIPLIIGTTLSDLYIGDRTHDEVLIGTAEYLAGLDDDALAKLTQVDVSNPYYVVAHTWNGAEIQVGALERISDKAHITQNFLDELDTARQPIEFINLVYEQPFIKLRT